MHLYLNSEKRWSLVRPIFIKQLQIQCQASVLPCLKTWIPVYILYWLLSSGIDNSLVNQLLQNMLLPSISSPSKILKLRHKMNLWVTDTYMYPLNLLRSLLGISQMMVFWKNSGSNKVFCKRKYTGSEH